MEAPLGTAADAGTAAVAAAEPLTFGAMHGIVRRRLLDASGAMDAAAAGLTVVRRWCSWTGEETGERQWPGKKDKLYVSNKNTHRGTRTMQLGYRSSTAQQQLQSIEEGYNLCFSSLHQAVYLGRVLGLFWKGEGNVIMTCLFLSIFSLADSSHKKCLSNIWGADWNNMIKTAGQSRHV